MFGFFKLIGGILCVCTNITILLRSTNIEDVVKDYVCVAIIAGVDDVMAITFRGADDINKLKVWMSDRRANMTDYQLLNEYILDDKVAGEA